MLSTFLTDGVNNLQPQQQKQYFNSVILHDSFHTDYPDQLPVGAIFNS